jgi:hypothetical protein
MLSPEGQADALPDLALVGRVLGGRKMLFTFYMDE